MIYLCFGGVDVVFTSCLKVYYVIFLFRIYKIYIMSE